MWWDYRLTVARGVGIEEAGVPGGDDGGAEDGERQRPGVLREVLRARCDLSYRILPYCCRLNRESSS